MIYSHLTLKTGQGSVTRKMGSRLGVEEEAARRAEGRSGKEAEQRTSRENRGEKQQRTETGRILVTP